jgi:hypothetical protein
MFNKELHREVRWKLEHGFYLDSYLDDIYFCLKVGDRITTLFTLNKNQFNFRGIIKRLELYEREDGHPHKEKNAYLNLKEQILNIIHPRNKITEIFGDVGNFPYLCLKDKGIMKATKNTVLNSILHFAEKFGIKENYQALIETSISLPKLSEMIVYEMFINEFLYYNCSDEDYENYRIILAYSKELRERGFVDFEK